MRLIVTFLAAAVLFSACGGGNTANNSSTAPPSSLSQVSAVRLNFRYEPDVPAPDQQAPATIEERNASVQSHFDQNRPQEILDRTLTSPDKKFIAAVYHRVNDIGSEYRLDMYDANGGLLRRVTPDNLAVHFPDTIQWAPNSTSVAFVGMLRAGIEEGNQVPLPPDVVANANANIDVNSNAQTTAAPPPTIESAPPVIAFRTEQIYICNADGTELKPITQSEGRIYFYYVWSPDSSMLAALVATSPEWASMQGQAQLKKELFVPAGRPRIVERNGRERLLDDAMTQVRPVWSPDSSKVAAAFDTQVRIYDANGTTPTQAAIPLRNQLLISSQAYDRQLEQQAVAENTVVNDNSQQPANTTAPATTSLPDPTKLVSFNPIVTLQWPSDDMLYFQTGYVKQFENPAENRSSYLRWHRLILSPQPMQQPAR
jgi:hypothetical protein